MNAKPPSGVTVRRKDMRIEPGRAATGLAKALRGHGSPFVTPRLYAA
jgi:hypothetical protein